MIEEQESAGFLLGETSNLMRSNAVLAAAAVGLLTLGGIAADLYPDFTGLATLASGVASLFLQYEICLTLLVHYDLVDDRDRRRRIWALLGLNLLSGIAIVLGLVLLIVPGVYLLVRWSAALPAMIAEDSGITESLGLSAEVVDGRFWHVFASILVVWLPGLLGAAASELLPEDLALVRSMVLNLSINLALVAGWHLAVAIYAGRRHERRLAEVFA
jgi:hypothetical protein